MTAHRRSGRRTWIVGLGISAAAHAAVLLSVKVDIRLLASASPERALEVVRLAERDPAALEVVPLETAERVETATDAPSGARTAVAAVAATPEGPAGAAPRVAAPMEAVLPNPVRLDAVSASPPLVPAPAEVALAAAPAARAANRGVVLARGGGSARATSDFDFARDDDDGAWELGTGFGADGQGGSGGIGISIMGIGGEGHCDTPAGIGGVDLFGPGGGLPAPRGRGILGRRAPGGGAINRSLPGRSR